MSCDTDNEQIKLAKEYKYLLSTIRPLIDQLDKTRDVQLCLLWLSKMEQCGNWERKYRNYILCELCKQVKANNLKPPFSSPPPNGPLRNAFLGHYDESIWTANDVSADLTTDAEMSTSTPRSKYSYQTISKYQSLSPPKGIYFYQNPRKKECLKALKGEVDHSECYAIQKAYHERAQSDQLVIEKYQEVIKNLVSQKLKNDVTPNRLKKVQASYENKLKDLMYSYEKALDENEMLKKKLNSATCDLNKIVDLKKENEALNDQITNLVNANNDLKKKIKENEDNNIIKCTELKEKLSDSEKKLRETEKRLKSVEKHYEEKYQSLETEIKAQKSEIEKRYNVNLNEMERLIDQKNSEIAVLKDQLSNQCSNFEEEMARLRQNIALGENFNKDKKKMKILKSKARKLEKVREHMAVLFHSQLQQIIAKKDFYIETLEMQLKMFTSDLRPNNTECDTPNLLTQKVFALEGEYRKLLKDSEKQFIKRRQMDLQKIHNLEKKLLLCGSTAEDSEPALNCLKTLSLTSLTAVEGKPKRDWMV